MTTRRFLLALASLMVALVGLEACSCDPRAEHFIPTGEFVVGPGFVDFTFEPYASAHIETMTVAMPFRLEERYAIIEMLAREVMPRVGAAR